MPLSVPVLEVVIDSPDIFADIKAARVADRDGGVGDLGGGHGKSRDGHPLRKVIPVVEGAANLQIEIQSNPLNGSPDNGSIQLLVQALAGPILVLT